MNHQPPETTSRCPVMWCVNHQPDVHIGEVHSHGSIQAWLVQADGDQTQVFVDGHLIRAYQAGGWAHTFARIDGGAELAATVRRLGELAAADQEFVPVTQESVLHHTECTVGARPGFARNPTTYRFEPTVVTP